MKSNGATISLFLSIEENDASGVKKAIKEGADVNSQGPGFADDESLTPLMLAVKKENYEIAELLLNERKINVDAEDAKGETALIKAVKTGNFEVAALLLTRGANPCCLDKNGKTAREIAKEKGLSKIFPLE